MVGRLASLLEPTFGIKGRHGEDLVKFSLEGLCAVVKKFRQSKTEPIMDVGGYI